VLVYERAPKTASLGSWDMYSLALRGRVMGLQSMTLLILKQFLSASYRVSGMGQGSSYYSCRFCFCCSCCFRSFVNVSLLVVALCRSMTSAANAFGKVVAVFRGWYMFVRLCNLAFRMGDMSRTYGACSSTESEEGGGR
jgi:hypothetical protein